MRQVCEALDQHTQSWAMCMADLDSVIDHTGMEHALITSPSPLPLASLPPLVSLMSLRVPLTVPLALVSPSLPLE